MGFLQAISIVDLQARASLKSESSKLALSYLWWILEPILFVSVYYIVFSFLLNRGTENYILFLMCGKIPYLWFSKSITSASNSLLQNKGLVASIQIPKTLFPYINLQEALYKQWVVFLLLIGVAVYFDEVPTWEWLWLIPIVILNYLLIVAISLWAALLVTLVQDLRFVVNMSMLFLMFMSGVFWDIRELQDEYWQHVLLYYNPLAFLIDSYRVILIDQGTLDYQHLLLITVLSTVLIVSAHFMYIYLNSLLTDKILRN